MIDARVWPHWMVDPEYARELADLETQRRVREDEYVDEHRIDRLAAGLDEYEVGVA